MTVQADQQTSEPPTGHQTPLRWLVAALVALEALLLIAVGLFVAVLAPVAADHDGSSPLGLFSIAAIALIVGAGIGVCARGVFAGRRWTRGPVVTWQLLQAGVGVPLSTALWWLGVPLLAVAVVVGVLMLGRQVITEDANRF